MKKENQLLSRVLKAVGLGNEAEAKTEEVIETEAATETVAEVTEAIAEVATEAELETVKAKLEAVTGELQGKLEEAVVALADMTSKYEAAQTAVEELQATISSMVGEATTAKLKSRYEKVVAAIGTEKADGLMAATEGLDDAAFEAVVSALAGSVEAEAKTDLFQEVGITAEADAVKVVEESEEMKLLKQRYGKQ